jgi:hypothetical protein
MGIPEDGSGGSVGAMANHWLAIAPTMMLSK